MSGFTEICLVVVLVSINPALIRGDEFRPALKLTYEVRYNTSSPRVSQDCGRQYASEFLESFIQVESRLGQVCRPLPPGPRPTPKGRDNNPSPGPRPPQTPDPGTPPGQGPNIQVYVLAKVTIMAAQIVLDTYLNITNNERDPVKAKDAIERCGDMLNQTFSDISGIPWLREEMVRIAENGNCSEAQMHPERLDFSAQEWDCPTNFTYNPSEWRCVPNGPGQPSVRPPITRPTSGSNTEEEDEEDDCDLRCVKQLEKQVSKEGFCQRKSSQTIPCIKQTYGEDDDGYEECMDAVTELEEDHKRAGGMSCDAVPESTTGHGITSTPVDIDGSTTTEVTTTEGDGLSTPSRLTSPNQATEPIPTSPVYTTAPYTSAPPPDDWGITFMDNRSSIHLVEGGRGDILVFRPSANLTSLCGTARDCSISIRIFFVEESLPRCRSTNRSIPQVVVGQHGANSEDFCSVNLTAETLGQDVVVPLTAKLDSKYDDQQVRSFSLLLVRTIDGTVNMTTWRERIPVLVTDSDRKSTCQSINDPHITTFDGFQYNNYYSGEFVLYHHKDFPFKVHTVYQKCGENVSASCNCAVAVQSDDDVIVIDRCRRKQKPVKRLFGETLDVSIMSVTLYLNGELTPGTRIFQEADGKKYFIYLPNGTYIKALVSGDLVNVWVVGSAYDFAKTKGLCGNYTADAADDLLLPNGTVLPNLWLNVTERPFLREFSKPWRVDLYGPDSLLQGVPPSVENYQPNKYCECGQTVTHCGYGVDVETCDTYQGTDVTKLLVQNAVKPVLSRRRRRAVEDDNTINAIDEPIDVDPTLEPPDYVWNSIEAEAVAKNFCRLYLEKGELGKLCSQVPGVNIKQEVTTCVEDIQITGNISWASSARDALKEQCWEQIRKNGSLPQDMVDKLANFTCVNSCSDHGLCMKGKCHCDEGFTTSDCSTSTAHAPYVSRMPEYGLCDVHLMNCSQVIVYGKDFINTQNLSCHLQETNVEQRPYKLMQTIVTEPATFINFNAIECPIPNPAKSYFISVSNDGLHQSDPLLFIPVDSKCRKCNVSNPYCYTFDTKFCTLDSRCYSEGQVSDTDPCLRCERTEVGDGQWVTIDGNSCRGVSFQDWQIAVIAAIAGSIIGLLVGLLLYWCCCMSRKGSDSTDYQMNHPADPDTTIFSDTRLHRNHNMDVFQNPETFHDLMPPERGNHEYDETFFHNNGQGVENGVDDTTYF